MSTLKASVIEMQRCYGQLHDRLSDMIEGGRLTKEQIPKDYRALVRLLIRCNSADEQCARILSRQNT